MTETRHIPQDSVAVVTGGAGAIGGSIAQTLRSGGHRVVIVDRNGDVGCDLADADQVRRAGEVILLDYGRCDLLVHAAGAFDRMTLETLDLATFRKVQAVNVEAILLLAEKFAPGMSERHFGRIISIVSTRSGHRQPGTSRRTSLARDR